MLSFKLTNISLNENTKCLFKEDFNEEVGGFWFFSVLLLTETVHQFFYKHFYRQRFFFLLNTIHDPKCLPTSNIRGLTVPRRLSWNHVGITLFLPFLGSLGEQSPWAALGQLWDLLPIPCRSSRRHVAAKRPWDTWKTLHVRYDPFGQLYLTQRAAGRC